MRPARVECHDSEASFRHSHPKEDGQMIYVTMHGRQVPALGFGTWQLNGEPCIRAMRTALDVGYRHIDTAQAYENEAEVGRAIAGSGMPRDELFVTTKVWTSNFAAPKVKSSVDESLRKLRMDHVDLLLMHWPSETVPMAETLGALQEVQAAGKTLMIGVSNFTVALMREAVERHRADIACNQVEYHALLSQKPVLDYARAHGIAVTAYSPLARGKLIDHPVLRRIGERHGKTSGQVALRWLIQQSGVMAIPKATSERNIRQNVEIFDFELDERDLKDIAPLTENDRQISPSWAPAWDIA
jgi:2,5-diketo-D-gluconate reductase B